MREDARPFVDGLDGAAGHQGCGQHRQGAEGQQQEQQVFHRYARAGQQGQQDHRGGDQAGRIEEIQHQSGRRQQLLGQADGLGHQRQGGEQQQQGFARRGAPGQVEALVGGGAEVENSSDEAGQQGMHKSL
ncbi:hypothetical protein D9M71_616340 [compost metagenome]